MLGLGFVPMKPSGERPHPVSWSRLSLRDLEEGDHFLGPSPKRDQISETQSSKGWLWATELLDFEEQPTGTTRFWADLRTGRPDRSWMPQLRRLTLLDWSCWIDWELIRCPSQDSGLAQTPGREPMTRLLRLGHD